MAIIHRDQKMAIIVSKSAEDGGRKPLTVCSAAGLRIEQVMGYYKWFILAMFVTLMIVCFTPFTAIWFK